MLGVVNARDVDFSLLKVDLLFVDRVRLVGGCESRHVLARALKLDPPNEDLEAYIHELTFLLESGYFEDVPDPLWRLQHNLDQGDAEETGYCQILGQAPWAEVSKRARALREYELLPGHNPNVFRIEYMGLSAQLESLRARATGEAALPIASHAPIESNLPLQTKIPVISLAMRHISVPDARTPWQDIFALKEDKNLMKRARMLVRWCEEVEKQGLSIKQASELLDDTLLDYEIYMKGYKIKHKSSLLKTIITGSAGILENVLKLKVRRLAEMPFAIAERKADAILAELQAPGRAVSFISVAQDRLR